MPYTGYTIAMINNIGLIMSNVKGTRARYGEEASDEAKTQLQDAVSQLSILFIVLFREASLSSLIFPLFVANVTTKFTQSSD